MVVFVLWICCIHVRQHPIVEPKIHVSDNGTQIHIRCNVSIRYRHSCEMAKSHSASCRELCSRKNNISDMVHL